MNLSRRSVTRFLTSKFFPETSSLMPKSYFCISDRLLQPTCTRRSHGAVSMSHVSVRVSVNVSHVSMSNVSNFNIDFFHKIATIGKNVGCHSGDWGGRDSFKKNIKGLKSRDTAYFLPLSRKTKFILKIFFSFCQEK